MMGANAYQEAHKSLEKRFEDNWNQGRFPAVVENAPAPKTTAMWARFTVLFGTGERADLGTDNPWERHVGLLVLQVFLPPNEGARGVYGFADEMARVFREKTLTTLSGGVITTYSPAVVHVGRLTTTGGEPSWTQKNIQIPFKWEETFERT